jgi:hypothetical protein
MATNAAVWAYSLNSPGNTCEDARLLGDGSVLYPYGNERGQAGWDYGLDFSGVGDLSIKLGKLKADKDISIIRLAINLHGLPGKIDANSLGTEDGMLDFKRLVPHYFSQLCLINRTLSSGAIVLFMGCNVGKGEEGSEFLMKLSDQVFSGHKVVGFTTISETMQQYRSKGCSEPGMRDTPYENPSEGMPTLKLEREKELLTLPWASEESPHAKVAFNGKIIKAPTEASTSVDYSPDAYLPGSWTVTIGKWNGWFMFKRDHTVLWADENPTAMHPGKWYLYDGGIEWYFSDDSPQFRRRFTVPANTKPPLNGNIVGGGGGVFTMYKMTDP